jgi:alpha 1,2-mannosyltransferase
VLVQQSCSRLHQHPGLRLLAKKVWLAAAAEQQCASTQIRSTTHQLHGTQPPATSGGLAVLSTPHASALNTSYLPATVTSMRHVALMTLLALPSLFADRKHDDSSGIASLHDDVTRPQPVERQPTARRQYVDPKRASRYRTCESCVAIGYGWDIDKGICGSFANSNCFGVPSKQALQQQHLLKSRGADKRINTAGHSSSVHLSAPNASTHKLNTPRGAILMTYLPKQDDVKLKTMLQYLETNYNCLPFGHKPIFIMYDHITPEQVKSIQNTVNEAVKCGTVHLVNVDKEFELPANVDVPTMEAHYKVLGQRQGYRSMCRFWSGIFAQMSFLDEFDFYWRMDYDSFLLEPLQFDPFKLMEERNLSYMYRLLLGDSIHAITGLTEAAADHFKSHQISLVSSAGVIYNNFELGRISFFRSSAYQSWFNYLDKTAGFHHKRWGDAPVRTLAVEYLLDPSASLQLGSSEFSVHYEHASTQFRDWVFGDRWEKPCTLNTRMKQGAACSISGVMEKARIALQLHAEADRLYRLERVRQWKEKQAEKQQWLQQHRQPQQAATAVALDELKRRSETRKQDL